MHQCDESGHGSLRSLRPSAGGFLRIAPVGLVGLDLVGGDDFAGVEVDDGDGGVVGDGDDALAGVFDADGEVVHLGGASQAQLS